MFCSLLTCKQLNNCAYAKKKKPYRKKKKTFLMYTVFSYKNRITITISYLKSVGVFCLSVLINIYFCFLLFFFISFLFVFLKVSFLQKQLLVTKCQFKGPVVGQHVLSSYKSKFQESFINNMLSFVRLSVYPFDCTLFKYLYLLSITTG